MNTLLEYLLPLVKVGGLVIAYKGANLAEEFAEAENAVVVPISCQIEMDIAQLDEEEQKEFLETLGVDDLIRKDSVWFTEKKKSGVTDLYKLTDFRGVNRLSSIREAYRNQRFGATMN